MTGPFHSTWTRLAIWFTLSLSTAAVLQSQDSSSPPEEWILEGVIVAENPGDSVALIRSDGATRARVIRIGEALGSYVLVSVERGSARLRSDTEDLRLSLEGAPPQLAVLEGEKAEVPAVPTDPDDGWIRRTFPRTEAKERLQKEMPVILRETDFEPRVEDGEVRGLSVAHLPDGTLLSECGLLPGDVLVSVNGEPLRGGDSLWELLSRLLDEREIRVVVRRKGEVVKLAYALTN